MNRKIISVVLTGLFLITSWTSTWFEISAVGIYSEGIEREPTITTDYMINNNAESFELIIENSTPLLLYWINRENVSPDSNVGNISTDSGEIESRKESNYCSESCLDAARIVVKFTMLILFVLVCMCYIRPSRVIKIATISTWVTGALIILISVPLAIAIDFGITDMGDEENSSSTGGFDTNTKETVEEDQFAHFEEQNDFDFSFNRINFYYESLGFDLGLVDEDDRANVSNQPPIEGDKYYDSLIQFNGEMSIKIGDIMIWWLLIAPLLYVVLFENRKLFEEE